MKKKSSLRVQLIFFLLLFVVAILGFVYVFQTTFLDDFYKRNKIATLKNVGNQVSELLGEDDIDAALEQAAMHNEVCIRVVSNEERYNYVSACPLRNLDPNMINIIAQETAASEDSEKLFDDFRYQRKNNELPESIYIYARLLNVYSTDVMILVSSGITPLNVTISTIKSQYVIIAAVVIAMTILLALLISHFILKLSKGKYDGAAVRTSSREMDELNESLTKANEDILKADKAKKELLGNVSHDLRTPLTMIVGYGEMIRDLPEENTEENINVIIEEAKRLSDLVNDLIDISKTDAGSIELEKETVEINGLLESVYHQYEKYCESQGISLQLKLGEDMTALLDVRRIKQVLYNFINNSLNYNDKDRQEIVLGTEPLPDGCRIYVYDNGEGIAQEDLENIWDRYFKVDKEHKRQRIGSGIGLSLSKELLIAHELAYGVESEAGKYSKFYFDVKRADRTQ